MSGLQWSTDRSIQQLGWTLIQFLWQGTVLAGLFALARGGFGHQLSSGARYAMACVTLVLMAGAPIVTFVLGAGLTPDAPARWLVPVSSGLEGVMPLLVVAWLLGVIVCSIRLLGGWLETRRLARTGVRLAPPEWQCTFDELIRRLNVSLRVQLLVSALVDVPVVVGWLRPIVLVPVGALTGLPAEYVTALLVHELAHIRRRDYLVNLLQCVAEAVLFYHPAIWWVSKQIRIERETCCDDIVVATQGEPLVYARALTELDASRRTPRPLDVAASGPSLLDRVRRLLGHTISPWHLLPGPGALAAIAVLLIVGVGAVAARDTPPVLLRASRPTQLASSGLLREPRPAPALLATAILGPIGPSSSAQTPKPATTGRPGPPPPPPPPAAAAAPASGVVRGRIVREDNSLPLRNVQVTLSPVLSTMRENMTGPAPVSTDESGRFELTRVEPGQYHLSVAKSGFVTTFYGQRGVNGHASPIAVTNGKAVEKIDVSLSTGGVIIGQLLDQAGDPLSGIAVRALEVEMVNGTFRPGAQTSSSDVTDDRGRFRVFGLAPGRYFLGATPQPASDIGRIMMTSQRQSAVTLYPGTFLASQAQTVLVEAGRESAPLTFTFLREKRVVLAGVVSGSDGRPVTGGTVSIRPQGTSERSPGSVEQISGGGRFRLSGVSPGEYLVTASNASGDETITEPLVVESDSPDIALTLRRAATLRGRIVLDSASRPSIRPADVSLAVVDADGPPAFGGVEIRADWTFEVTGLVGRKDFGFAPPEGWRVKAIRVGNRDKGNEPLDFDGHDIDDVQVILTNRITNVTGRVTNGRDPVTPGVVLLFADDREKWYPYSGFVDTSPLDAEGRYSIEGLPPGRYLAVALTELGPLGASVFENLRSRSVTVTLGEAERKTLDLKLSIP